VPTYLIEGKKVRAEKPLTEAEIDEIGASIRGAPAPAVAPPPPEVPAPRREMFTSVGRDVGPAMALLSPTQKREALAFGAGFLAGPAMGAVARTAGTALPAIQRVTTPLATAFETGGIQTGLTKTTPTAARVATRVAGGAVPGAITGAIISPEEATTGAAIGTGVALLAPPVARIVAKGGGAVVDALAGRTADARANQLIRLAANDEVNALRAAMTAQPDVPASRAAADLDLPVLQALLAEAEKKDPRGVVNAFRQREAQDTINELSRIAGGPTAETARAARESAKDTLTAVTAPLRKEAFEAAARTGEVMPKLETIATNARAAAKTAVDTVRRLSGLVNKADDWASSWVTQRGIGERGVRLPGRVEATATYPGQLAASGRQTTTGGPFERMVLDEGGVVAQRIAGAAEESVQAGARARAAESTLQSMKDRGLKPITAADLTGPITQKLKTPDIATNREASAALTRINQMLGDWTNEFGVVTPEALYAIRKNGVAGVIRELNPGMDAKSQDRLAASVLTKIKPLFDDAIEKAGGKGFKDYLKTFERGMSDIRGMELADRIRAMYKEGQKQQIVDLIAGESPDVVEDLFGSGRYKISEEMAKDMPLLRKIADTVGADLKAVQQAASGRAALTEAQRKTSARIRFPFFTRASTAVNEVVAGLEQKMKAETLDVLIRAAQSGRDFNRVLDAIPTKERNAFLAQFKNAESWSRFSTQVANAARTYATTQVAEPTNALAAEVQ
jgi:hypothetical protein